MNAAVFMHCCSLGPPLAGMKTPFFFLLLASGTLTCLGHSCTFTVTAYLLWVFLDKYGLTLDVRAWLQVCHLSLIFQEGISSYVVTTTWQGPFLSCVCVPSAEHCVLWLRSSKKWSLRAHSLACTVVDNSSYLGFFCHLLRIQDLPRLQNSTWTLQIQLYS